MRRTLREQRTPDYWATRWNKIPVDEPAEGHDRYPLLYSDRVVGRMRGDVLELGCGAGRLLRYYHQNSWNIVGADNVAPVVEKLKKADGTLNVVCADARKQPFESDTFATILCFGVFHSLEDGISEATEETFRVLKPGGFLCAEFRADTLHNRLIDWFKQGRRPKVAFHKWNFLRHEVCDLVENAGFVVEEVIPAINMPLLYHIRWLRHHSQRNATEHEARISGYRLRRWLDSVHSLGAKILPTIFANLYIVVCRKPLI